MTGPSSGHLTSLGGFSLTFPRKPDGSFVDANLRVSWVLPVGASGAQTVPTGWVIDALSSMGGL